MTMRDRYWRMLVQFKFAICYYREHLCFSVLFDRYFKLFIAVFTASSVASWGIWETYSDVWAVIVALAQLAVIINESLPYKGRISKLQELLGALGKLFDQAENKWRDIDAKELSDDAINDAITEHFLKWEAAEDQFLKGDYLLEPKWLMNRAQAKMIGFFNFYYGDEEHE